MRKTLKFFGVVLSTLVLFVIVAGLGFYHLIRGGELRRFLISEIEAKTEFKVQLGEADAARRVDAGIRLACSKMASMRAGEMGFSTTEVGDLVVEGAGS